MTSEATVSSRFLVNSTLHGIWKKQLPNVFFFHISFTIKESPTPLIHVFKFTMKPASTIYSTASPLKSELKGIPKKKIKRSFGHGNVSGDCKKTYYVLEPIHLPLYLLHAATVAPACLIEHFVSGHREIQV